MRYGYDRTKKKKQSKNEMGLRSTFNRFGARTLIGAPKDNGDGPIRSFDESRVRCIPNGHRSDLPLFGEGVGVGGNQVVGSEPGGWANGGMC